MSVKAFLREKGMQVGTAVMVAAPAIMCAAGATNEAVALEGDGATSVTSIIQSAVTGLKSDAMTVIAAGVGLGVVFWGAKVLWKKFKGMAT